MNLSFSDLTYSLLPKSGYLLQIINFHTFYAFWIYFIFLLLVFCKFLGQNWRFTLKIDSEIHDNFVSPSRSQTLTLLYVNLIKSFGVVHFCHHNYHYYCWCCLCATLLHIDVMSMSSRTSSVSAMSEATLPSIEQAEPDQKHHTISSAATVRISRSIVKGKHEGYTLKHYKLVCQQSPRFVLVLCLYFQHVYGKHVWQKMLWLGASVIAITC